ncbi:nucleotidyltransferase family protein [Noviherbaspirillum denitrificans]|uniref:Molybdopterin-guanine dinucleotide biosynthesis protein MobA n=1 Tax=Noviherbaspirillum denitrificans TaxID=1968433 RepID=A0A254TM26_9BURK|nr:nucleotidyltransferase family protein [Noviherbaspirillum denitrificans]OWW20758.1 molybdopterin-guanine dinucleotide biosynthesis protein MobA [Noviherbaspirillum denitrificans]
MIAGILLAAGRGSRFDPSGQRNKLLQPVTGGEAVAVAAARNLLAALPSVLAVVGPGGEQIASRLKAAGCEVSVCPDAGEGMGATLVYALRQKLEATGWVVALGDMPFVQPETIRGLAAAIELGADIAAPFNQGRRGNPVAFGRTHLDELLQLRGDEGARRLLGKHLVTAVEVNDPGIFHDIDTPDDLRSLD